MNGDDKQILESNLVEDLAHFEHDSWARWMMYLFSKSIVASDGCVTIPSSLVKRWARQADTPYSELSEPEKESDRKEVYNIIPAIQAYVEALTEKD